MTKLFYNEKSHDRALEQHDRAWERMHRAGQTDGRGSEAFRTLRQDVIDAARVVRLEARRPKARRRG